MSESFANPPTLAENGEGYEEWKLTKMWMKFTKFRRTEQGSVLAVKALKGEARSLALSLPEEDLDSEDGVDKLLMELDKLYLKDKDTMGYDCWKKLSTYSRSTETSILSYCAEFRRLRIEAKRYSIEISDTTFSYMLMDKCNFSEEQKVLILSIALSKVQDGQNITPEYIEAAMRRIQGACSNSNSQASSTTNNDIFESQDFNDVDFQSLSTSEKDEIVEHAMYTWQNKRHPGNNNRRPYNNKPSYSNNFRGGNAPHNRRHTSQEPMVNPRDIQTGEVMRCHGCNSRFHLYRSMKCPNNAKALLVESKEENLNVENIYASECDFQANNNKDMTGYGVLDSAATKTVCGKQWFDTYKNYLTSIGKTIKAIPSNVSYKFGNDGQKKSLFGAVIPIYIFGQHLNLQVDVISSSCPLLMGRPTLERLGLVLNFKNSTAFINDKDFPLQRSEKGHFLVSLMFDQCDSKNRNTKVDSTVYFTDEVNEIYFAETEIDDACEIVYNVIDEALSNVNKTARKLHLIFGHPTSDRLIKTLESGLKGVERMKLKSLCKAVDEYTKSCGICKDNATHKPKPKVCLPMANNFNDVVAFDITFWLDPIKNKTVMILHLIDIATRLSAATVVCSKDSQHIIDALVCTWLNVFGAPKKFFTDNGGEFANKELVELVENLGIEFKATAAESSFSNGINERHHAVIKSIMNKIRHNYSSTDINVLVSYAVFAKNCLVDNRGFTPHQRVYGHSPNIPSILSDNVCSSNTEYESNAVRTHLNLLHDTRQAYVSAESSDRIKRALKSHIFVSEAPFNNGEKVFYWKESQVKSSRGWKGPAIIIGSEGKVIVVRHGSFIHRCHETKVRRASEGCALSKINSNEKIVTSNLVFPLSSDTDNSVACDQGNILNGNSPVQTLDINITPNLEYQTTNTSSLIANTSINNDVNEDVPESPSTDESTTQTRILRPRANIKPASKYGFDELYEVSDDEVSIAKMKELNSWKRYEVYKEVEVSEANCPLITTRWVFSTKENEDKSSYLKARLVVRGFQDIEKDTVVSESPTAHIESLKVTLALLPTLGFRPKKMDISTAFLQGKSLGRSVYVKPPTEAEVNDTKCWMLLKGAYGLTDASRMWYDRVNEVLIQGNYQRSSVDPALYFKYGNNGDVLGTILCHVDDFLFSGTENETALIEMFMKKNFDVRTIEEGLFVFCGFQIEVIDVGKDGEFKISFSQPGKISNINPVKIEQKDPYFYANEHEEKGFRSVLGALQWHSNSTRPDLAFSVSKLLGETKSLQLKHCTLANKLLRKAKANDPTKITCVKLKGKLALNVYTDASYANLPDLASQRGTIAFMEDETERKNIVEFKSKRIKRVCRSTFSAELLACNAAVDYALCYRSVIKAFGIKDFEVTIITDSKSIKDNLATIVSRCEEKSLRVELAYLREVLSKEGIKIRWVSSSEQLADVLTKEKPGLDILNILSEHT